MLSAESGRKVERLRPIDHGQLFKKHKMSSKIDWARSRREKLVRERGSDPIAADNTNVSLERPVQSSSAELHAAIVKWARAKSTLQEFLRMLELSGFGDRERNLNVLRGSYPALYEALKRGSSEPFARCPHCKIWLVAKSLLRHIKKAHTSKVHVTANPKK